MNHKGSIVTQAMVTVQVGLSFTVRKRLKFAEWFPCTKWHHAKWFYFRLQQCQENVGKYN